VDTGHLTRLPRSLPYRRPTVAPNYRGPLRLIEYQCALLGCGPAARAYAAVHTFWWASLFYRRRGNGWPGCGRWTEASMARCRSMSA